MTHSEDQRKEIERVNGALAKCGYLSWCFRNVKHKLDNKVTRLKEKTKQKGESQTKTMVTLHEWGLRSPTTSL